MRRRSTAVALGLGAAAGAAAALATRPAARDELRRLRAFLRPLDLAAGGEPVAPPLPPGRSVSVPGRGEFFVRGSGDGSGGRPAVLLLHGWGATADSNFFRAYEALAGYRVVALDHRAHGRGPRPEVPFRLEDCADDAAAVLGALGISQAVVVGYSMGGPVALLLAGRHPAVVAGLVLQATALEFSDTRREQLAWHGLTLAETILRHSKGDDVVQRMLREAVDKEPSLERYRSWLAGEFRRGHLPGIIDAGRALSRFDARGFAGDLAVPAAVVLTLEDRLVPPRKQRALAAALGAPVLEIDGDHDVCITNAEAYGVATRAAVDLVRAAARATRAHAAA